MKEGGATLMRGVTVCGKYFMGCEMSGEKVSAGCLELFSKLYFRFGMEWVGGVHGKRDIG